MKNIPILCFGKFLPLSAFALLFLMSLPSVSATEEISESWELVRVYSRGSTGEGETVITQAEEVSEPEVPGGKRAFRLPAQGFLRFNPRNNAAEPRDFSFAKIIKARIYATSPATFAIRIGGGGPTVLRKLEHSGTGWELLELNLEELLITPDDQNKITDLLSAVTLIDFGFTNEASGTEDFLVADVVAE